MGEGGTQSNKVHKFALNDVSVSTVLSKIVKIAFLIISTKHVIFLTYKAVTLLYSLS